jgi:hypothetical protein
MNRDEQITHLRAHLAAVKSGLPETHWPAHICVNSAHVDALLGAYDDLVSAQKPAPEAPVEVKT